jgi:hypothetical protein
MNFQSVEWAKRFNFLALSAWLTLGAGLAVVSLLYFQVDFCGYYAAARVFMEGGNPYDYRQVAPVLLEITGMMVSNLSLEFPS